MTGKRSRSYRYTSIRTDHQGDQRYLFVRRKGGERLGSFGKEEPENLAQAHLYCAAYDAAVKAARELDEDPGPTLRLVFGSILGEKGIHDVLSRVQAEHEAASPS